MSRLRIGLVDDQELVRTGFAMIIDVQSDMEVVGNAADGLEAIELVASRPIDVLVMDVRMPRLDGVEATRRITAAGPSAPRVLILTTFDLDEHVYAGLQAGASGFLLKDAPAPELLRAIRTVASGDAVVGPTVTRRLIDRYLDQPDPAAPSPAPDAALDALTPREHDVLLQLAAGLSNVEIGQRLFLAEATVKTHVGHILNKLGLRDRVQAVVFAYRNGVVPTS